MSGSLQRRAIEHAAAGKRADRFVDLAIDLCEWGDSKTTILEVGGRWDTDLEQWHSEPKQAAVWRVHPGQYESAYWFAEWFRLYAEGVAVGERPGAHRDVSVLLADGGRGGGKTHFGVAAGLLLAVGMRQRIVWMVSPTEDETLELQRGVESLLPESWYTPRGLEYHLPHLSQVLMLSGYDPGTLKRGRVDYFLLNEAQRFAFDAYKMVRPRLADTSGLGYLAANPPRDATGQWVMTMHDRCKASELPAVRLFEFDHRKNPTLDQRVLETTLEEFGEEDYRREILGEMLPVGDHVFYAWTDIGATGNVRPVPEVGDITGRWLQRALQRPFAQLVGIDLQLDPHMAAAVLKFFVDPDDPKDALSWYVDYVLVEGLEEELMEELEGRGYAKDETALVLDASAWWQDAERTKGKDSQERIRKCGWRWCYRPDRKMKKNPDIVARAQCGNARFRDANGKRHAFSDPSNRGLNEALKLWENRGGVPYRRSIYAHLCDAATYPLWRLWPRRSVKRQRFQYERVERERSELERDLELL